MSVLALLNRWRQPLAERAAARAKYESIIYFNGPRTVWDRARQSAHFEEHPGGLRIALPPHFLRIAPHPGGIDQLGEYELIGTCGCGSWRCSGAVEGELRGAFHVHAPGAADEPSAMMEPHEGDILQRRSFRTALAARIWVLARLRGFDTTKMVGEVRRL